jgi:hypothetical protein
MLCQAPDSILCRLQLLLVTSLLSVATVSVPPAYLAPCRCLVRVLQHIKPSVSTPCRRHQRQVRHIWESPQANDSGMLYRRDRSAISLMHVNVLAVQMRIPSGATLLDAILRPVVDHCTVYAQVGRAVNSMCSWDFRSYPPKPPQHAARLEWMTFIVL